MSKARADYDAWLAEFRIRRDDLLGLLQEHHRHNYTDKGFGIYLHANGRAIDQIRDACLIAEALMVIKRDELSQ